MAERKTSVPQIKLADSDTCRNPWCLSDHYRKKHPLHTIEKCTCKSRPSEYKCNICFQFCHHEQLCNNFNYDDDD